MQIDSIAQSPDRAGRHLVKFSDGSTMRLYRQTVEDFGLYTGLELSEEQIKSLRSAAGQMSAKMRAVRIVAASNVSKSDLEQRLVRKGESKDQAKAAVQWMSELNLLDDERTARQLVDSCVRKGYGLSRAKQVLYEKQIPKQLWEQVLADYPDQTEKILQFLRTRLGSSWDAKDLKRAVDALLRRGHSYSEIRRALECLEADSEEFREDYEWQI
ncbi:MAG: regulatory protein RecX [Oscillospiraceae bacterium]|nr:regulatory protein RecX [Oscillospiraceae bacterium]